MKRSILTQPSCVAPTNGRMAVLLTREAVPTRPVPLPGAFLQGLGPVDSPAWKHYPRVHAGESPGEFSELPPIAATGVV